MYEGGPASVRHAFERGAHASYEAFERPIRPNPEDRLLNHKIRDWIESQSQPAALHSEYSR